ncbi:MAG: lipopolysaccharide kinase InaA family protein [Candidatus Neomarinimicrobiota bacterium]
MFYNALHGRQLAPEQIERLCDREWIKANARHIYKDKVNILAEVDVEIEGVEKPVVIKWFSWRNRISLWLSPFMRSRAKKSWDASQSLKRCGVKVPPPITAYTRRRFGIIRRNFLLTEIVTDYTLARRWLRNPATTVDEKTAIVTAIAELIRKMHDAHMVHHDLTPGNFLVKNSDPTDITITDLNRLEHKLFLSRKLKAYDIAKLNLCNCRLVKEHSGCLWILFLECYDHDEFDKNKIALRAALKRREINRRIKAMRRQLDPKAPEKE